MINWSAIFAKLKTSLGRLGIPPDYLGQAQKALAGAWLNPLADREAWLAYIAEGVAAFAPKFLVFLVSFLFAAALGEEWWKETLPLQESTPESIPARVAPILPSPPKKSINTPKRLAYVPGVEAWVKVVTPKPGGKGDRYKPGQAHPFYVDFCKAEGYTPAPLQVFGQILMGECGLKVVARTGGQSHYEFNLRPQLALVKSA